MYSQTNMTHAQLSISEAYATIPRTVLRNSNYGFYERKICLMSVRRGSLTTGAG